MTSTLLKIFLLIVAVVTINTDSFSQTKLEESIENQLPLLRSKRIIGIGESTHNSHQERMFAYSLIKELVKDSAFNIVFIEAPTVSIEKLNDYINSNDKTDIRQILLNTPYLFWLWKTNEFAQFLTWLKEYNKTTSNKIKIIGGYKLPEPLNATSLKKFNNERDSLMAFYIHNVLNSKPNSKAVLLAHNLHIANRQASKGLYIKIPLGRYLKELYGDNYFSIGQLFGTGSFSVQIRANFNELETSYVKKDVSKLSKQLNHTEKSRMILTDGNKLLDRNKKMWFYGGIMNTNGQKTIYKGNISKMFDAIVFYDSIYASSNLLANGNYFAKTVHLKSFDKTINKQILHYKLDYNSTRKSLLEIQFYKDDEFVYSIVDTLQYNLSESLKAINLRNDFNNIRSNLYLFEDGEITINSFTLFSENDKVILNDLFQSSNNKETPLGRHSKTKLVTEYKNGRFEMHRYTDEKKELKN